MVSNQPNHCDLKGVIHMKALYTQTSIISKLKKAFFEIFSEEGKHTKEQLFDLLTSILCLNGFQSVKYCFEHFIENMSENKLKSYYFTLNESKIDLSKWMKNLVKMALSVIPEKLFDNLIILSIDDTMVEKYGEHFENRELLFDHAGHNGSNYLNGHCFVSIMLSIPIYDKGTVRYISFPVGYRMWTKDKTKLAMTADLVTEVMGIIGSERNVCLLCDSWYPKAEITELPQKYENLTIICNVRHDTALYDLPPEKNGKKGRPKVRGDKLTLEDFDFSSIDGTEYSVGSRPVITRLFGNRAVHAIVTKTKSGSTRLFICTKSPEQLNFDFNSTELGRISLFAKTDLQFLPLTIYSLRWNIEVAYYEQKKFWSFGTYMLRSKVGIERLTNLLSVLYSFMTLLPFYDSTFFSLASNSPQQSRFVIGMTIWHELFSVAFDDRHTSSKNVSFFPLAPLMRTSAVL